MTRKLKTNLLVSIIKRFKLSKNQSILKQRQNEETESKQLLRSCVLRPRKGTRT
jgi:hypothetical protein